MSENVLQQSPTWESANSNDHEQVTLVEVSRDHQQPDRETLAPARKEPQTLYARQAAMEQDLGGWGVGLVILGVLHMVLSSFLNPAWGIALVIIGLLTLFIRSRGMFLLIGLGLWAAAWMNLTAGAFGYWTMFGLLQIYWGFKEIIKFFHYRDVA